MSQYITNTSDKKKKNALIFWAIGILGLLGFENFYVGKIKKGIIHFIVGILAVMFFFVSIEESVPILGFVFWAIVALPNLFKILIGTFKDNTNVALRE